MLYSCFDQSRGLYRVFQDDRAHPINGDLPVPTFPDPEGRVGVASIVAARKLPAAARFIGSSWNARGIVVQCPNSSFGFFETPSAKFIAGAIAGVLLVLAFWPRQRGAWLQFTN